MDKDKRLHERIDTGGFATLTSSCQEKGTATINNISFTGLLISNSSFPLDKTTQYKIEIPSVCIRPSIILSGEVTWQKGQHCGLKISHYHLDSKELLEALIVDLKAAHKLVERLNGDWLNDLFVDCQGKLVDVTYK